MEHKYIVVYCKMHKRSESTLINILSKTKELYERLKNSYVDEIKILVFGIDDISKVSEYLPKELIEYHKCKDIEEMSNMIWSIIRGNKFQSRVYLVLVSWKWRYIEPLLRLKHENYKFFFEGALDTRSVEEIREEEMYEKSAKVRVREGRLFGLLDSIGSSISTDLKG